MKVFHLVVWGFAGLCGTAVAQDTNSLRLEEAVTRALSANPAIAVQTAELQAVRARADRESLPTPYVVGGEVTNFAGTGSLRGMSAAETTLSIGRVIELGGKREAREALGRAEIKEQRHRTDTVRIDLTSLTSTRFIKVLAKQQELKYAEERIRLAGQTRQEVAARVASARSPKSDLQAAEIALAEAELDRKNAMQELASARMALAASWGASAPDFDTVAGDLYSLPPVEPFETLAARLSMTPELQAARLQTETLAARGRVARASAKPDIEVNLGVRRLEAYRDHALMLSVSIPLGSGTRSGYAVAEANAKLAANWARRNADRLERHQDLFERYQELMQTRTEVESLRKNMIPEAEGALAATRRGFEAGRFPFISLAQAQRTLFDLRERAGKAASRYHLLLVEVERLTATVEDLTP